jgi:hypothetical protein
VSKAQGYAAVSPLARRGLVEKEGSRYRLSPPLEDLFSPLRRPQEASPSEEKPKRAKGDKPKPDSPVAALAQAHPHLKGLLHFAGQTLPKVAQPLAAKAPGVLVGAALAARKYGRCKQLKNSLQIRTLFLLRFRFIREPKTSRRTAKEPKMRVK